MTRTITSEHDSTVLSGYSPKAWALVSSKDSSNVKRGSRSGREKRQTPKVAILAPVGEGGAGRGGVGLTVDLAGKLRPQLLSEAWCLHTGGLGHSVERERERNEGKLRDDFLTLI